MIPVIGGGFGLYGHVAALAGSGRDVATLSRYRAQAEARPELADLVPCIRWVDDVMTAARDAEAVVLAQTPSQNTAFARQLVAKGVGGTLIIEKPVAESPAAAAVLEAEMAAAGRRWAVPYLFAQCDWATDAAGALAQGKPVEIDWTHRQSPMVRGWKREADAGGGAIGFYFIHFIALAEALLPGCAPVFQVALDGTGMITGCTLAVARHCAHSDAIQSRRNRPGLRRSARNDEDDCLKLRFSLGQELAFRAIIDGETIIDTTTPFGPAPTPGYPDPRIPMLAAFHQRVATDAEFQPPAFHSAIARHWAALEAIARA